ncbi:MAG: redoxin domain-containing protein [Bacteroidetes bacterium]|nr:redoxin domain-containing protein [Bacteroidota bacterium]
MNKTVYDFELKDIKGAKLKLSAFRGKKILLVNTASECGYTPQYAQLEELHQNFKDKVEVVGFPCNDFGGQEPRSEAELEQFCELNYGVTFPQSSKIKILGHESHPLYQYLTQKKLNGFADSEVKWNFQKYLCDENGKLIGVFSHAVSPVSEEILHAIEKQDAL